MSFIHYPTECYIPTIKSTWRLVYVPEDEGVGAHKLVPVEEALLSAYTVQQPIIGDTRGDQGWIPHAQVLPVGELLLVRGDDVQLQLVSGLLLEVPQTVHAAHAGVAGQVGHPVDKGLRRRVLEVKVLHAALVANHRGQQHGPVDEGGQARHGHRRD